MNELTNLPDILSLYQKFGWQLRQVLLTAEEKNALHENALTLPANAEIIESEVNALWFSRSSGADREAWELRLISPNAYALFEVFSTGQTIDEQNDIKNDMEMRLIEYTMPKIGNAEN